MICTETEYKFRAETQYAVWDPITQLRPLELRHQALWLWMHMANKNDYTVTWMMKPQWTLNNVRFSLQQIKQILNKQLQKYYKNRAALWTPLKFTSHGNIKILNLIEKLKCCNFNHTRTLPIFSQGPITFWEEFVKLGAPEWSKTVLQLSSSPVEPLHKISPDVTKHAIAFLV